MRGAIPSTTGATPRKQAAAIARILRRMKSPSQHILTVGLGALAALAALASTSAHATTAGLSVDPMGSGWDRGDLNTGYAIWDTFPNVGPGPFGPGSLAVFADDAADSGSGLTSPLLDQTTAGAARTGGGDRIYSFGTATSWTIDASTAFTVKGFTLQMKQFQDPGTALELVYAPTLNGLAADYVTTNTFLEGADTNSVTTWWWGSSLDAFSYTNLTVQIDSLVSGHHSVDAIAIDAGPVSVVPEPSAATLLGGTALLGLLRRRRGLAS